MGKPRVKKTMMKPGGAKDDKMKEKLKEIDADMKCWVGGLKPSTTFKKIKEHFTDNGCEPDLCVITRPGTACVTFKSADEASTAIGIVNGTECDGKDIQVDAWTKPEKKEKKKKDDD